MNVTAAARVPAHVARPAPTPTTTADTEEVTGDAPTRARGGSDTPFTHALEQGNGRKVGIHRRMPTAEEVAAEQFAAGLDPVVDDGAAAPDEGVAAPIDPSVDAPVEDSIVVDASDLAADARVAVGETLSDAVEAFVAVTHDPTELLLPDEEPTA